MWAVDISCLLLYRGECKVQKLIIKHCCPQSVFFNGQGRCTATTLVYGKM